MVRNNHSKWIAWLCPFVFVLMGCVGSAKSDTLEQSPSSQPAAVTQRDPDTPIIRIGDTAVITLNDFDIELGSESPEGFDTKKYTVAIGLVNRTMVEIYLREHPELLPQEELEKSIQEYMKSAKVTTMDEFERRLKEKGYTLEYFRRRHTVDLVMRKFNLLGTDLANDENYLKKMWETRRDEWDGSRVIARHIMLSVPYYYTPEQKKKIRARLEKMKADLVSGARTWNDCVRESDCTTKMIGGSLGEFRRHLDLRYGDELADVAFALDVDEYAIAETAWGCHLIQTTEKLPPWMDFKEARKKMVMWVRLEPQIKAMREMFTKHKIIGVQVPIAPPDTEEKKKVREMREMMKFRPPPRSQPASSPAKSSESKKPVRPKTKTKPKPKPKVEPKP